MKKYIASQWLCAVAGKKFFSFFLVFLFLQNCFAVTKTWTGLAGDGMWSSPNNWSGNSIPLTTDDVLLDNSVIGGSYTVTFSATSVTVSVNSLTITPASGNTIQLTIPVSNTANPGLNVTGSGDALVLNNGAILMNSTGVASGGVGLAIANTFRINNGAKYVHNNVRANASIVSQLSTVAGTENGVFEYDVPTTMGYTASISNRKYGTLIFNATAAGGTKVYTGTGSNPLTINGDLQINNGATINADLATANGNIIINGNYIQNGGTFNISSGAGDNSIVKIKGNITQTSGIITETNTGLPVIELDGTAQQTVSIQGTIANSVSFRINNSAGAILSSPLILPYKLELLNGNITTSSTNLLTLQTGATISVDSTIANTSYIDGPLRKEGLSSASNFLFPVGKNGKMYWLELKNATGNFNVELIKNSPRDLSTNYGSGIDHVGTNYYWNVDADISPSASANVELSFPDVSTSGVTDVATLRAAQLISGVWTDDGNISTTGSAGASGSVVSATVNTFNSATGNFALSSNTSTQNPLAVTFISFVATKLNNNSASLNWQIDLANDVSYFEIQSSDDTSDFKSLEKIHAKENERSYQFTDDHLSNGIIYYRIKLVAKIGEECFSKIVAVNNNNSFHFDIISSIPVTSNNNLMMRITSPQKTSLQFNFLSTDGAFIKRDFVLVETGENIISLNIANFATGIYILQAIDLRGNFQTKKFIKP
jgi:hypothetical protein